MDSEFIRILANMGFPALVAGFLLFRLNGKLERLANAMTQLAERIERLLDQH